MTRMTKAQQQAQREAQDELREILSPGDTVGVIQRHVSRSGMMRYLSLRVTDGRDITRLAALAMGEKVHEHGGHSVIKVSGCGMDMHFHTVYGLARTLWPNGAPCAGRGKCRSNDHSNDYGRFAREYDAAHDPDSRYDTLDQAGRSAYVAARQAWIGRRLAKSYRKNRNHNDGGYSLTRRSL